MKDILDIWRSVWWPTGVCGLKKQNARQISTNHSHVSRFCTYEQINCIIININVCIMPILLLILRAVVSD